jgi:hypothetical protein
MWRFFQAHVGAFCVRWCQPIERRIIKMASCPLLNYFATTLERSVRTHAKNSRGDIRCLQTKKTQYEDFCKNWLLLWAVLITWVLIPSPDLELLKKSLLQEGDYDTKVFWDGKDGQPNRILCSVARHEKALYSCCFRTNQSTGKWTTHARGMHIAEPSILATQWLQRSRLTKKSDSWLRVSAVCRSSERSASQLQNHSVLGKIFEIHNLPVPLKRSAVHVIIQNRFWG